MSTVLNRISTTSTPSDGCNVQTVEPRVLFVDQTGQLGGAELCLYDLVRSRAGQDCVLLFEDGPFAELLSQANVDVEVCRAGENVTGLRRKSGLRRGLGSANAAWKLARELAKKAADFDVIYANTAKAFIVSAIGSRLARRPVIYHLHDILSPEHFSGVNRGLLVRLANLFALKVVANSHASAEAFVAAGGTSNKVSIVYNGFETEQFERSENGSSRREQLLREIGAPDDAVLVAVFGRLAPWKGQHIAIEAIKELPKVRLLLVGDALFGEQEYVQRIRSLAENPAVAGRVHFLGFRNDVASLMSTSDIVVHCSTAAEPFGRVIVEAMLCGRPVIATDAGGAAEIIQREVTGLLTPAGDVNALCRSIDRLIEQPRFAASLATAGQIDAQKRFRLADRVSEINDVVLKALS